MTVTEDLSHQKVKTDFEVPDINSVRQTQGLRHHNGTSFLCEEVSDSECNSEIVVVHIEFEAGIVESGNFGCRY